MKVQVVRSLTLSIIVLDCCFNSRELAAWKYVEYMIKALDLRAILHCDKSGKSHTPPSRQRLVTIGPYPNNGCILAHLALAVPLTTVVDHVIP